MKNFGITERAQAISGFSTARASARSRIFASVRRLTWIYGTPSTPFGVCHTIISLSHTIWSVPVVSSGIYPI